MSINVPQRERSDKPPSDRVRAVAARVRVNADKRVGEPTPQWIVKLAESQKTGR